MKGTRLYGLLAVGALTLLSGGCAPDRIVAMPDAAAPGSSRVAVAPSRDGTPLVIVDGHRIAGAAMNAIDPNDIDSVEVFKGETAVATYGEAGKNGVIVIKTRRGAGTR
jgi:TonB-dependent SusC/RagA subfamily outer membrane receptor